MSKDKKLVIIISESELPSGTISRTRETIGDKELEKEELVFALDKVIELISK